MDSFRDHFGVDKASVISPPRDYFVSLRTKRERPDAVPETVLGKDSSVINPGVQNLERCTWVLESTGEHDEPMNSSRYLLSG